MQRHLNVPIDTAFLRIDMFVDASSPMSTWQRPAYDLAHQDIAAALLAPYRKNEALYDLNKSWMAIWDEMEMRDRGEDDQDYFHATRIAGWIMAINTGSLVRPCQIEFPIYRGAVAINDGNHRYRALRHLEYSHFPVDCSGGVEYFEQCIAWSDATPKNFTVTTPTLEPLSPFLILR